MTGLLKKKLIIFLSSIIFIALSVVAFFGSGVKTYAASDKNYGNFYAVDGVGVASAGSQYDGYYFQSTNAKVYNVKDRAWADKFGVRFYIVKESSWAKGDLEIIMSSVKTNWYERATGCGYMKIVLKQPSSITTSNYEDIATDVDVYVNSQKVYSFTTERGGVIWLPSSSSGYFENSHINNIAMGKMSSGNWGMNISGLSYEFPSNLNNTFNAELEKFDESSDDSGDYGGYCQFYLKGDTKLVYMGLLYGIGQGNKLPDGWSNNNFLENYPTVLQTSKTEKFGWYYGVDTSYGGTYFDGIYSLSAPGYRMPLNGYTIKFRATHGSKLTQTYMTFCSAYLDHWFAATYSIAIRINWDPSIHDDSHALLDFSTYEPNAVPTKERSLGSTYKTKEDIHNSFVRFSETVTFNWFGNNEMSIFLKQGKWCFTFNGVEIFKNSTLKNSDGHGNNTVSDFIGYIEPYVETQGGLMNIWGFKCGGETYFITGWNLYGGDNKKPQVVYSVAKPLTYKTYKVTDNITVNLNEIFTDPDGDTLIFFASKGNVSGGVWTYNPKIPEDCHVTFRASDTYGYVTYRLHLTIIEDRNKDTLYLGGGNGTATPFATQSSTYGRVSAQGGCSGEIGSGNFAAVITALVLSAAVITAVRLKKSKRR